MSLNIIQDLLPPSHSIYGQPMEPEYVTIHETANVGAGANAAVHGRYMRSEEAIAREVTWHFTVDDTEIWQHLPLDINGWHAGDGFNGPGNRSSIGIEICVNQDGDFAAAQRLAASLVAHLIRTVPSLRPFPECVVQHNRWSGKDCPHQIRTTPGGWERFVGSVQAALGPQERPAPAPGPTRQMVSVLDAAGNLLCEGWLEDGSTVVKLRPLIDALGLRINWDPSGPAARLEFPGSKR